MTEDCGGDDADLAATDFHFRAGRDGGGGPAMTDRCLPFDAARAALPMKSGFVRSMVQSALTSQGVVSWWGISNALLWQRDAWGSCGGSYERRVPVSIFALAIAQGRAAKIRNDASSGQHKGVPGRRIPFHCRAEARIEV